MAKTAREAAQKIIADNRKAHHDYHLLETFEAGVALLGTEVKSIREGGVNLRDSFARIEGGEIWIYNVHIAAYRNRADLHWQRAEPSLEDVFIELMGKARDNFQ